MTDPQKYTNRITNLVHLTALTVALHNTALEEVKTGNDRPLHQATGGDLTTEKLTEAWKITHDDVTKCVREIQAQAWEEGHAAGWQEHHDCYITNTRDPENPADQTTNPYKETSQ